MREYKNNEFQNDFYPVKLPQNVADEQLKKYEELCKNCKQNNNRKCYEETCFVQRRKLFYNPI